MKLYLLRHGDSEPRANTDLQRLLTHRGRQQAVDVALQFCDKGHKLDRCFVSPYTRAIQTADTFLSRISGAPRMEIQTILSPEVRAAELIHFLEKYPNDEAILLVTHNPLVSELNAVLVEGNIDQLVILGTCDLCVIDLEFLAVGMGRRRHILSPQNV